MLRHYGCCVITSTTSWFGPVVEELIHNRTFSGSGSAPKETATRGDRPKAPPRITSTRTAGVSSHRGAIQRAKDAEGFLALFHPDAVWTAAHGKVLIGFDAIAEFTGTVLPKANWDGEVTTGRCTRSCCAPT